MTTVVFADLVGSTALYERLGDASASGFVMGFMNELRRVFERHEGRVVKLLGDGLLVVFTSESLALAACVQIQKSLFEKPLLPPGGGSPAQLQIGMDAGDVVEINGDCFGDTVNSAARLADLAGAAQILTTQNVWAALPPVQQMSLRSMGPLYLRGRTVSSHVYRVEWQSSGGDDATLVGRSMSATPDSSFAFLELTFNARVLRLDVACQTMSIGRLTEASMPVNDPRVSRLHASLTWRGGQFVLTDTSSFGTWVYLGDQGHAVVLRRTECLLVGSGLIVPGCDKGDEDASLIGFCVKT